MTWGRTDGHVLVSPTRSRQASGASRRVALPLAQRSHMGARPGLALAAPAKTARQDMGTQQKHPQGKEREVQRRKGPRSNSETASR